MSQHDYDVANGSGAAVRADLNNALGAIATNNSGTSAPSTTFAYQWWADTTNALLKQRNAANSAWVVVGNLGSDHLGLTDRACQGRLTLTSGTPVTTGDVTAATTLYFTPFNGNRIELYDGSAWRKYSFTERSIAVPATTSTMYDVFIYDNAGTLTLELTAWTNDTTRATSLTTQDGVLVKSGATTRRYLGSFRTTGSSGQTEDSFAKRYVWNYYHRVRRTMRVLEGTDSWNYTTATLRQANGSTANQLDYVVGVSEDEVEAQVGVSVMSSATIGDALLIVGIGVDSTSANSAQIFPGAHNAAANRREFRFAQYRGYPGIGRHTLVWLEYSTATGTTTWYGDNGAPTLLQSGIHGSVMG